MEDIVSLADKVYRNLESILQDHLWIGEVWGFIQDWKGFSSREIMKIDLVQVRSTIASSNLLLLLNKLTKMSITC